MKCPICNGTMVNKKGKFGEFKGCVNYPKCEYTFQTPQQKRNTNPGYNNYKNSVCHWWDESLDWEQHY